MKKLNPTTYTEDMPTGDGVEIGDKDSKDFRPHLKLNRWGGECFIKVSLPEQGILTKVEGDRVCWANHTKEVRFYPLEPSIVIAKDKDGNNVEFKQNELGGFEFEVILKEKPQTNKIALDIETQGLKFYYQPELTPEEIEEGCLRPNNVVGSYAIYHATKGNIHKNKTDAEKYKCGKAFHIYRPKVTDAEGKEIWADLAIDEVAGTLIITIDQIWLDGAVYPVSIDPNFGNEAEGGTSGAQSGNYFRSNGASYSPAEDGILVSIKMFGYCAGAEGKIKGGVYLASDNSLTEESNEIVMTDHPSTWQTMTFPTGNEVVSTSSYYMGTVHNDGGTRMHWDTGAAYRYFSHLYANDLPATASWSTTGDRIWSIYCLYVVAPSPPTNVDATDGDHTDKVVIEWTKSDGATKYEVFRDGVGLGELGDVAIFEDTGADAPTITPGTGAATDGLTAYVTLSLSGESANNGTTHTYTVKAGTGTSWSGASGSDTGYRGVGSLTLQWQVSDADSDADYNTNISGATTDPYNYEVTHIDGRYYRCYLTATGVSPATSAIDRGWRKPLEVTDGDLIGIRIIRKS